MRDVVENGHGQGSLPICSVRLLHSDTAEGPPKEALKRRRESSRTCVQGCMSLVVSELRENIWW